MDVVRPISVTLFFLVLLLLPTQSLDMIDDEVSYLRGVCCLVWFELAFFLLTTLQEHCVRTERSHFLTS